jgi:hypothetical protein
MSVIGGTQGGTGLAHALAGGFEAAMIVMAALCAGGALITALFVSDARAEAPRFVPHPRAHACALPVAEPTATP